MSVDPLYNEESLVALGSGSFFKPETFREGNKVDNVKDVLIEHPIDYRDGGSLTDNYAEMLKDMGDDARLISLGKRFEGRNSSKISNVISKIVDFVKNIFSQIGEALSSVYRFVSNVISKSNTIDEVLEDSEVIQLSPEDVAEQREINDLLDYGFGDLD